MTLIQNIKIVCFVLIILLGSVGCSSTENDQPSTGNEAIEIQQILTLGGTRNESAQSVVSTSDGGYAVLGYTQSMDEDILNKTTNSYDYLLLKFSADGEQQWQKIYGGTDDDRGQDIIVTNDGGYAIIGSSKSSDNDVSANAGYNDFWLAKLNSTGTILWEKSLGYAGADSAFSVIQTQDQGYLLSGVLDVSASGGEGNSRINMQRHAGGDYWVIKLDTGGNLQWSRYFGGTFTDTAYDAVETQNGNFIIVGSSDSEDIDINNNKGSYDFWVLKVSSSGTLIWEKSYGGSEIDEARAITGTQDGNFIIVGDSRSNDVDISSNNGAADIWAIKINSDGDVLWENSYGGSGFDGVQSIYKTQNNDFIVAGNSRSDNGYLTNNNGQNDAWLFKINTHGTLKAQSSLGGSDIDLLMDVTELENGTIIGVGNSNSSNLDLPENKGFTDILIINASQ